MTDEKTEDNSEKPANEEKVGKIDKKGCLRDEKGRLIKGTAPNNPAGGQPGIRHKATKIKQAFFEAFDAVGGVAELVRWIKAKPSNQRDFYKMAISVLPKELDVRSEHEELKLIVIRAEGYDEDPTTITINRDKPGAVEINKPLAIEYQPNESEERE